jgi:hypothetical protein
MKKLLLVGMVIAGLAAVGIAAQVLFSPLSYANCPASSPP